MCLYKFSICLLFFLLIYGNITCGAQEDECLFDIDAVEQPKYLQSPEFIKAEWDDKNKVANIVTKQNDFLVVTYSACENIGIEAELSKEVGSTALTQEYVSAKVIWLAKKLIDNQQDLDKIKKIVKQRKYKSFFKNGIYNKKPMILGIDSKRYSEVIFGIEMVNESLLISLVAISY